MAVTIDPVRPRRAALFALLLAVMAGAALVQGLSFWPGIMTWDSIRQYGQAVDGDFDDWHPPAMGWLWRQLIAVEPGPGPMLALQLALYWLGYALMTGWALRRGRAGLAVMLAACALMPFPLVIMGSVLKDCLMEGAMLATVGLLAWSGPQRGWAVRMAGIALLLFVSVLRFNAFLATLPLVVALLPAAWRRGPVRLALASAVSLVVLVSAMPLANRLLDAEKSGVELSLVIFDLGGITTFSGEDMFPSVAVRDPVAVTRRCYKAQMWDSFSPWGYPRCPINFDLLRPALEAGGHSPYLLVARAALRHPIAYAEHRLGHFNLNARFLVHDEVEGPAPDRAIPNEWHYEVPTNAGLRVIHQLAVWSVHSPLGWPIFWMALAAGMLGLSIRLPSRGVVVPIALSALLYGLGYLLFSVASELRYHLWTITGTAIAAAIVAADLAGGAPVPRRWLVLAGLPALLTGLLCTAWRLA